MKLINLFETNITREETLVALNQYVHEVKRQDFGMLYPALKEHFPKAVYSGQMTRAIEFPDDIRSIGDMSNSLVEYNNQARFYSWSKTSTGMNEAIGDLIGWGSPLLIFKQVGEGIDVNDILGRDHDHAGEEEIIAMSNGSVEIESLMYGREEYPPELLDEFIEYINTQ